MQEFNTIDELLDFAISEEAAAHDFYTDLAAKMERQAMKKIFLEFAEEEKGHEGKLVAIKQGELLMAPSEEVTDLKIADYLVEAPKGELTYQDALIVAMNKEKAAFRLYTNLAAQAQDAGIREALLALAQEEAKHKLRFEIEYDENVFDEN